MSRRHSEAAPAVNSVCLEGRVCSAPVDKELPSGAVITTFRLSMARQPSPMTTGSKQTTDWVDCVAWGARPRRSVRAWTVGDWVVVDGALRRRFYRAEGAAATRVEVEVLRARRATRLRARAG
jgi:single-strand DNA-binding protein